MDRITEEKYKKEGRIPSLTQVFVQGLPKDIAVTEIYEFFAKAGNVKFDRDTKAPKIHLYCDKRTGNPLGECTVSFASHKDQLTAMSKTNGALLKGIKLKVSPSIVKPHMASDIKPIGNKRQNMKSVRGRGRGRGRGGGNFARKGGEPAPVVHWNKGPLKGTLEDQASSFKQSEGRERANERFNRKRPQNESSSSGAESFSKRSRQNFSVEEDRRDHRRFHSRPDFDSEQREQHYADRRGERSYQPEIHSRGWEQDYRGQRQTDTYHSESRSERHRGYNQSESRVPYGASGSGNRDFSNSYSGSQSRIHHFVDYGHNTNTTSDYEQPRTSSARIEIDFSHQSRDLSNRDSYTSPHFDQSRY